MVMLQRLALTLLTGGAEVVSNLRYVGARKLCLLRLAVASSECHRRMEHGYALAAKELKAAMIPANTCGITHSQESDLGTHFPLLSSITKPPREAHGCDRNDLCS